MPKPSKPPLFTKNKTLWKYVKSFEKIFEETQADVANCMRDHQSFEKTIQQTLEENNYLSARLSELTATLPPHLETADDENRKLTHQIVSNYEQRLSLLEKENASLTKIWASSKRTIYSLEAELRSYKAYICKPAFEAETNQNYEEAIKLLEHSLKLKSDELEQHMKLTDKLIAEKTKLRNHITNQQREIEEQNPQLSEHLKCKRIIDELKLKIKGLEANLKLANDAVAAHAKREKEKVEKAEEALALVEEALRDNSRLAAQEEILKQECKDLAKSVGAIMDEASAKVDEDAKKMRKEYEENVALFKEERQKYEKEITELRNEVSQLQVKAKHFQTHLKTATQQVELLNNDKQQLMEALDEASLKLQDHDILAKSALEIAKSEKQHEEKIAEFLKGRKKLEVKYAEALKENTEKFQKKIYDLEDEISRLNAQLEMCKMQIASYQFIGDF